MRVTVCSVCTELVQIADVPTTRYSDGGVAVVMIMVIVVMVIVVMVLRSWSSWSCYRGHCAGGASGTRTRTRARACARSDRYRIADPRNDGAGNSNDTFVFFFESHPLAFRSITGCEIQRYHGNMKELT